MNDNRMHASNIEKGVIKLVREAVLPLKPYSGICFINIANLIINSINLASFQERKKEMDLFASNERASN